MKRSSARNLAKAGRLYRRRRFSQVITFLEPQVFLYRESYRYYYLLGMSCLYTGDYAGAFSYLQRALDIEERPNAMLGLGAVLLRRRQTDQALRNYLDLIDIDNGNRRAKRALQWLRNVEHPDEPAEWFEDRRIRRILPPIGPYLPAPTGVIIGIVLLVLLGFLLTRVEIPRGLFSRSGDREGSELVEVDSRRNNLVEDTAGSHRFDLTSREVQQLFSQVGDYFNAGRDNMVRRELNRITLSNAAPDIKARAEMLRDYLKVPDFSNFQDDFSYSEVDRDPVLHEHVFVRWRGRIANIDVGTERIRFDLLVGYHTGQIVEGIVPVELDFAVLLDDTNAIEVIGRIELDSAGAVLVRGTSIRMLSQRELG